MDVVAERHNGGRRATIRHHPLPGTCLAALPSLQVHACISAIITNARSDVACNALPPHPAFLPALSRKIIHGTRDSPLTDSWRSLMPTDDPLFSSFPTSPRLYPNPRFTDHASLASYPDPSTFLLVYGLFPPVCLFYPGRDTVSENPVSLAFYAILHAILKSPRLWCSEFGYVGCLYSMDV